MGGEGGREERKDGTRDTVAKWLDPPCAHVPKLEGSNISCAWLGSHIASVADIIAGDSRGC
jgi:hypothetical protein